MNYSNLHAIPTVTIRAILNSPYCVGVDGADYYPVKEESEAILYERQARESEKALALFEREQREHFKALHKTTKSTKQSKRIYV